MSVFPIGLLITIAALVISAHHLNQTLANYYDFVAVAMVFGGTLAVSVMILPWEHLREVLTALQTLIWSPSTQKKDLLYASLDLVRSRESFKSPPRLKGLPGQILQDGRELISLGFEPERIELILYERVHQAGRRSKKVANAFKSLSKYPPAFGLMGTVLGLVNLMRGLANGLTAAQTGLEMAVALVATFYGLLLANGVINPAGELVMRKSILDEELSQIAVQAVVLAAQQAGVLESQELLNSYVGPHDRVDVLNQQEAA